MTTGREGGFKIKHHKATDQLKKVAASQEDELPLRFRAEWADGVSFKSSNLLSSTWSGLVGAISGAGIWLGTIGLIFVVAPALTLTLGAFGTAGLMVAPALLLAGVFGYVYYKKTKAGKKAEREKLAALNDNLKALDLEQINAEIEFVIQNADALHQHPELFDNKVMLDVLTNTLDSIQQMRLVMGQPAYKERDYAVLKQTHAELVSRLQKRAVVGVSAYEEKTLSFPVPMQRRGFFRTIGNKVGGFFRGLNETRREGKGRGSRIASRQLLKATGQFFTGVAANMLPFLGGFGMGVAIGGAVFGIAGMVLSATGIGAIAGLPLLAAGAAVFGGAMLFGLTGLAISIYSKAKHQERLSYIENNDNVLQSLITKGSQLKKDCEILTAHGEILTTLSGIKTGAVKHTAGPSHSNKAEIHQSSDQKASKAQKRSEMVEWLKQKDPDAYKKLKASFEPLNKEMSSMMEASHTNERTVEPESEKGKEKETPPHNSNN